ncbi:MAG: 50S ribosomal protein L18 [Patescibacteria group bacterium]|jgi:large subunit ribosomal protein L18
MKHDKMKVKQAIRARRQHRVRAKISGQPEQPRLSVFRSLKHIAAQLIDDQTGRTLAMADDHELKGKKMVKAEAVGKLLAERATKLGIKRAVFDRGSYKYHGRVKALADGARAGGLEF